MAIGVSNRVPQSLSALPRRVLLPLLLMVSVIGCDSSPTSGSAQDSWDAALAGATPTPTTSRDPLPTIVGFPRIVRAGGSLTASWSDVNHPTITDTVQLFPVVLRNNAVGTETLVYTSSCRHTAGPVAKSAGSCELTLTPDVTAGTYELRLYARDGQVRLATSGPVIVTGEAPLPTPTVTPTPLGRPPPTISGVPTTSAAGRALTATWAGVSDPTLTDWIWLAPLGADNSTGSKIQAYTSSCGHSPGPVAKPSGSCELTLTPDVTAGTYELRLYARDGYARLATSGPISVGDEAPRPTPTATPPPLS